MKTPTVPELNAMMLIALTDLSAIRQVISITQYTHEVISGTLRNPPITAQERKGIMASMGDFGCSLSIQCDQEETTFTLTTNMTDDTDLTDFIDALSDYAEIASMDSSTSGRFTKPMSKETLGAINAHIPAVSYKLKVNTGGYFKLIKIDN